MEITSKPVIKIPKTDKTAIWFCLDDNDSGVLANIRVFTTTRAGIRPTTKGLAIPPDLLPEFLRGVQVLRDAAIERGLLKG